MKKNMKSPELATFTLLNPDFHAAMDSESSEEHMNNANKESEDTSPDNTE
ncbi:hypothetical protein [Virgibacillus doumboii]|nr:hypothetical protein [Virgibacillus doumboii]